MLPLYSIVLIAAVSCASAIVLLLLFNCRRPEFEKISLFLSVLLANKKLPLQENVPVLIVTMHLKLLFKEFEVAKEAQETMPAFTSRILSTMPEAGAVMDIFPETVSKIPGFILSLVLWSRMPLPIVSDAHDALAVTVTVCPLAMVTLSPAVGITPPAHVDGLFQSPLLPETIGAAYVRLLMASRMMQRAFNRFIESFGFVGKHFLCRNLVAGFLLFFILPALQRDGLLVPVTSLAG